MCCIHVYVIQSTRVTLRVKRSLLYFLLGGWLKAKKMERKGGNSLFVPIHRDHVYTFGMVVKRTLSSLFRKLCTYTPVGTLQKSFKRIFTQNYKCISLKTILNGFQNSFDLSCNCSLILTGETGPFKYR